MYCTQCGIEIPEGEAFCGDCGAPAVIPVKRGVATPPADSALPLIREEPATTTPVTSATQGGSERPGLLTALAVWQFAKGALILVALYGLLIYASKAENPVRSPVLFIAGTTGIFLLAALNIVCGIGLLKLRPYGRIILLLLSWLELLLFPIGTAISMFVLLYLRKPGIKSLFTATRTGNSAVEAPRPLMAKLGLGVGLAVAILFIAVAMSSGFKSAPSGQASSGQRVYANFSVVILSANDPGIYDDFNGISERDVAAIELATDQHGTPLVAFKFTPNGAAKMAQLTQANIGRRIAFAIDREIDHKHAAMIREVLSENVAMMFASLDEANEFIARLKTRP